MDQIVFFDNKAMDLVDYMKLREKHKKFKFDWEDNVWQNTEISDDGWDNFMQRTRLRGGMSSSSSSSRSPSNECLPEASTAGQNFAMDAIVPQRLVNHSILWYPSVSQQTTTIVKANENLGIQILPINMAANANGSGMEEIQYGFQGLGMDDANQTTQLGVYLGSHIYANNSITNVILHSCIVEASAEQQPSEPLKTVTYNVPTAKEFYLQDWHYHRPAGVWIKPIRGRITGDGQTVRGLFYYIDEKTSSQMWSYFVVKQKDYLAAYKAAMLS